MTRRPAGDASGSRGNKGNNGGNTSANTNKNKRGSSKPVQAVPEEARPIIVIEGGTFRREPWTRDANLALCIGQLVRRYYPGGGVTSFNDWDDRVKRVCFNEFLKQYKLHENVNEDVARRLFYSRAADRFKDNLKDERIKALNKTGSFDPKDWLMFESRWVTRQHWRELCLVWARKQWREMSQRNTENRLATDDVAFSTTGSMTVLDHMYAMAAENDGQKPSLTELFVHTHSNKKTGQLISSKAHQTSERMEAALKEKYGDDTTKHPKWDVDTWNQVVGGSPHGHTYGLGSAVSSKVERVSRSSQTQPVNPPPGYLDNETVEKMIQQGIGALEERYKEREEEQKREYMEREAQREREFEEREAIRNEEYRRDLKQAILDSQMTFLQALNTRNDGSSSSRSLRPDKAPMEEPPYFANAPRRNEHHQANWYDPWYDKGDDDEDDEVIYESDNEGYN